VHKQRKSNGTTALPDIGGGGTRVRDGNSGDNALPSLNANAISLSAVQP